MRKSTICIFSRTFIVAKEALGVVFLRKKTIRLILVLLLLSCSILAKTRVAVLGVFGQVEPIYTQFLENRITSQLVSLNRLDVLDRTHTEELLQEIALQLALSENPASVGKILDAQLGLLVTIDYLYIEPVENGYRAKAEITLKNIEISTAKILATKTLSNEAIEKTESKAAFLVLENSLGEIETLLYDLFGLKSEIIKVDDNDVYILEGKETLVNKGVYTITRPYNVNGYQVEKVIGKLRYESHKDLPLGKLLQSEGAVEEKDLIGTLKAQSGRYLLYDVGFLSGLRGGLKLATMWPYQYSVGVSLLLNLSLPASSIDCFLELDRETGYPDQDWAFVLGGGFGASLLFGYHKDEAKRGFYDIGKGFVITTKLGLRLYQPNLVYEFSLEPRARFATTWTKKDGPGKNLSFDGLYLTFSYGKTN